MPYEFSQEKLDEIRRKFPGLEYVQGAGWRGTLEFDKIHEDYRIIDSYQIAICIPKDYPNSIPLVGEIGSRAKTIVEKHEIKDPRDLHCCLKGNAAQVCLCVKQQEKIKFPVGESIVFFMETLVVPYFYGLSYFEENKRWPWREYSHGGLGMLEYYAEDSTKQTKTNIETLSIAFQSDMYWKKYRKQTQNPNGSKLCICGSSRPFNECHSLAWKGLMRLHEDLRRLKLNAYKLFSNK